MASDTVTPQTQKPSSKRRNKKSTADAKAEPTSSQDASAQANIIEEEEGKLDGNDPSFENQYIRELQKNMRNVNKKLSGMTKVDSIVAENPGVPLDDLITQRKINADQKAQVLKKPQLQAQLKESEDQIAMHKKIEEDLKKRLQAQKEHMEAQHRKELEEAKESATPAPAPVQEEPKPDLRGPLLTLSKFLRAAAARRQESDETSEDSKGFEGVLLLLYGGDNAAVDAAEKLITGSSDHVPSTEGGETGVSYERVKHLATEYAPFASEEAWVNGVADASTEQAVTDPTITNAGLTELAATPVPSVPSADRTALAGPNVSSVDPSGANSAGLSQPSEPLADSWVSVPRPPEETENHNAAASAAVPSNQTENWAEQTVQNTADSWSAQVPVNANIEWGGETSTPATESWADSPMDGPPSAASNADGFHEVHHGRGPRGGRGGGGFDGRGRGRGPFRGGDRGRGDFRGRGRGGFEGRGGGRGRGRTRDGGAPGF